MPPRRQRKRLTSRKRSKSAPAVMRSPRKVKRKQWTNEQMEEAMKAVRTGQSGVNRAAIDHGVPRTTLKDRLSGRVVRGRKPGPAPYLTDSEEKELGGFLKSCAAIGYGKTRRDVMHIVESVAAEKGLLKIDRISQGWWNRFLQRQDKLTLRRGDNTAHVRMDAINDETMKQYFDLQEETLKEHNLLVNPAQIYNVDESGMPLDPKAPNIVTVRGTKKVRYRSSGRKGQVTVVACANAAGQVITPMVIYDAKNLNHAWTANEVPGTKYGLSDKGWITTELFEGWLSEHFLEYAVRGRPLLLLLDGHSTHYQPEVIRFARENEVIMLCLPPHTTHETQPLDCGVFAPLKAHWSSVCHDFIQRSPGKVITKFNFNSLFSEAWLRAVVPANILAGFRTCGVFRLNRKAIQVPPPNHTSGGETPAEGPSRARTSGGEASGESSEGGQSCVGTPGGDTNGESSGLGQSRVGVQGEETSGETSGGEPSTAPEMFTPEQEELFKRRVEEGYDLFVDKDYVRWLGLHHPQMLPANDSVASHFSSLTPQTPVNEKTPSLSVNPLTHGSASGTGAQSASQTQDSAPEMFTPEQEELFKRRVEEGYDLFMDKDYVRWLGLHHPQMLPANDSVASHFSSLTPQTPVNEKTPSLSVNPLTHESVSGTGAQSVSQTPSTSKSPSPSTISKFLLCPAATPSRDAPRSLPRARLLTSAAALAALEEKERKKQEEAEEREKKKREREEKKLKRQEEMKRKAAEKAKKAEEKTKKMEEKVRKAMEKANKAQERKQNTQTKSKRAPGSTSGETGQRGSEVGRKRGSALSTASGSSSHESPPSKKARCDNGTDDEIDPNVCCMCFGSYDDDLVEGTGAEWISCACGRWLHEDCGEECIIDEKGQERFCPFCLDLLSA